MDRKTVASALFALATILLLVLAAAHSRMESGLPQGQHYVARGVVVYDTVETAMRGCGSSQVTYHPSGDGWVCADAQTGQ